MILFLLLLGSQSQFGDVAKEGVGLNQFFRSVEDVVELLVEEVLYVARHFHGAFLFSAHTSQSFGYEFHLHGLSR